MSFSTNQHYVIHNIFNGEICLKHRRHAKYWWHLSYSHRNGHSVCIYSKTCLKRPIKKETKFGFQHRLLLNAGQKNCRMLGSILQYFRPSLSYSLSLGSLLWLLLRGHSRQVLLYTTWFHLDMSILNCERVTSDHNSCAPSKEATKTSKILRCKSTELLQIINILLLTQ